MSDPGYFDGPMLERQTLLWVMATRRQLDRYEAVVARIVETGLRHEIPPGRLVWEAEVERHLSFVAARNVLRGTSLGREVDCPDEEVAVDLKTVRDLLEHWDENMPVFSVQPQGEPARRSGQEYAARHPDRSPYFSSAWSSRAGPLLLPSLSVVQVKRWLMTVESAVLNRRPDMRQFLPEPSESPWCGPSAGPDRWFPKPSSGR